MAIVSDDLPTPPSPAGGSLGSAHGLCKDTGGAFAQPHGPWKPRRAPSSSSRPGGGVEPHSHLGAPPERADESSQALCRAPQEPPSCAQPARCRARRASAPHHPAPPRRLLPKPRERRRTDDDDAQRHWSSSSARRGSHVAREVGEEREQDRARGGEVQVESSSRRSTVIRELQTSASCSLTSRAHARENKEALPEETRARAQGQRRDATSRRRGATDGLEDIIQAEGGQDDARERPHDVLRAKAAVSSEEERERRQREDAPAG